MVRRDSNFKEMSLYVTKSRKRWPEKSAGRVWAIERGSFDFSGSFGYFSIRGKVTQCLNDKLGLEKK